MSSFFPLKLGEMCSKNFWSLSVTVKGAEQRTQVFCVTTNKVYTSYRFSKSRPSLVLPGKKQGLSPQRILNSPQSTPAFP